MFEKTKKEKGFTRFEVKPFAESDYEFGQPPMLTIS